MLRKHGVVGIGTPRALMCGVVGLDTPSAFTVMGTKFTFSHVAETHRQCQIGPFTKII